MIDKSRDARQDLGVQKFINNNGIGAHQYPTGFGKTTVAIKTIKRFSSTKDIDVVVPTIVLKNQWEEIIKKTFLGLRSIRVFVVNTYITEKRKCSLLILDEAHRFSNADADYFSTVITNCSFEYIQCLSASYSADQLLFLKSFGINLIDEISLTEACAKNWVSKFKTYNLELTLTEEEQETYTKCCNIMKSHFPYFEGLNPFTALKDKAALKEYCINNNLDYKDVGMRITRYNVFTAQRKALLYSAKSKIDIIPSIIKQVQGKIIIFSETQKYANEVHDLIGNEAVIYHSKLKKEPKEKALAALKEGKARVICTAKALDEGLDIPDITCGIIASGTSSERQNIQRTGRAIRFEDGKIALIINLYIKDTVEIEWLKKRQKNLTSVNWIKNVSEISI